MKKKLLLGLLVVVLAGIQFIRPAKNLGPLEPGPGDIAVLFATPPPIRTILAKACYDCHSDRTRYPWYAEVQPVGWWLASHIKDGRRHLNFSQFASYPSKRADHKLEAAIREIRDEEMPLGSYTLIHRDAALTDAESAALTAWLESVRRQLPTNP